MTVSVPQLLQASRGALRPIIYHATLVSVQCIAIWRQSVVTKLACLFESAELLELCPMWQACGDVAVAAAADAGPTTWASVFVMAKSS
jgi:hypothetical protein